MNKPLLSICIPTKNRAQILNQTLLNITSDRTFLNTDKIEVIISDNCSDDNTQEVCLKFKEKFPDKITYIRREKDILDKNFTETLKCANGKYAKLNNDTISYNFGALKKMVKILENTDDNVVFFSNTNVPSLGEKVIKGKSSDEFLKTVSYFCTWIGAVCVKTEAYLKLENPDRFSHLMLAQVDIMARLINDGTYTIANHLFMNVAFLNKKGGYNIAEVFGKNYNIILLQLISEGLLTKQTYDKLIKAVLIKQINGYFFDYQNKFTFKKGGYFKHLFKYYKYKPYYYINYLKHLIKNFRHLFLQKTKDDKFKYINICKFIKIRRPKDLFKEFRKMNPHNDCVLANQNNSQLHRIVIGKNSYGYIDALISNKGEEKLVIGNFCSIGLNVKFIVASEHNYKNISTFPFRDRCFEERFESYSKGSIILEDDVWIGESAIILSGVTIGQGAVIGAGAVVTKNVPPYAIVAGNPAKIIKYRFEPEIIEKLLDFDFTILDKDKIKLLEEKLYTEVTKENVDELLKEFSNV